MARWKHVGRRASLTPRRSAPWAPLLAVLVLLLSAQGAAAYSRSAVHSYADTWWNSHNPAWSDFTDDCANFVSQSVYAGGYQMVTSGSNPWYGNYGYKNTYSQSWRLVQYNRGFFLNDSPGGYVINTYYGVKKPSTSGVRGDIVYYAWYGDTTLASNSHEAIISVTSGTAHSTSDTGALVDAHNNNRYHEYWTLYKWNVNWPRTYYQVVHLYDSN